MTGLKITKLTQPVQWYCYDDNSDKWWMAAIEIIGLIPSWKAHGYVDIYKLQLISSNGKIVSESIISQAPRAGATSTKVSIGGKGIPADDYIIRVYGNKEESQLKVHVPPFHDFPNIKFVNKNPRPIKFNFNPQAKDVYINRKNNQILRTVERTDNTKYSAILQDNYPSNLIQTVSKEIIAKIETIFTTITWKKNGKKIVQKYIDKDRKEIEFFNDLISLVKYQSYIPQDSNYLLKAGDGTELLHNKLVAQILYEYSQIGYKIEHRPSNYLLPKKHDFNIEKYRCEVKTIQTLGKLEKSPIHGMRLTDNYAFILLQNIIDDIEEATYQIGKDGIIFLSPWSYKINGILRTFFYNNLSLLPPLLDKGMTVLILNSQKAFEDYYISFPTNFVKSQFHHIITNIQIYGVKEYSGILIKEGLPIQMTTAPKEDSSVGYFFPLE